MTMSPEAAVTRMNSVKGFHADVHNCGAQNPQLCHRMSSGETDEHKRHRSSYSRDSIQMDTKETGIAGVSSELVSPALLPRIDRLDILLDYLQDKRTTSPLTMNGKIQHSTLKLEENGLQECCKPMSWVVEKVQAKGTILDRIAALEERVTQLAEELERRKQSINVMEGVRLHLNGTSGCDIFVEGKKVAVTPILPCESVEKGLHEQFSRRILQTPKEDEVGMKKEEGEIRKASGKGKKGKFRRMLPNCMQRAT